MVVLASAALAVAARKGCHLVGCLGRLCTAKVHAVARENWWLPLCRLQVGGRPEHCASLESARRPAGLLPPRKQTALINDPGFSFQLFQLDKKGTRQMN